MATPDYASLIDHMHTAACYLLRAAPFPAGPLHFYSNLSLEQAEAFRDAVFADGRLIPVVEEDAYEPDVYTVNLYLTNYPPANVAELAITSKYTAPEGKSVNVWAMTPEQRKTTALNDDERAAILDGSLLIGIVRLA